MLSFDFGFGACRPGQFRFRLKLQKVVSVGLYTNSSELVTYSAITTNNEINMYRRTIRISRTESESV